MTTFAKLILIKISMNYS